MGDSNPVRRQNIDTHKRVYMNEILTFTERASHSSSDSSDSIMETSLDEKG